VYADEQKLIEHALVEKGSAGVLCVAAAVAAEKSA
jgi:hypothetical protein